ASLASKRVACGTTLNKWKEHQAQGTFPPHLRVKAPELQFTKEFGSEEAATAAKGDLVKLHQSYAKSTLSASIEAKESELAHLESALSAESMYTLLSPLVITRAAILCDTTRIPNLVSTDVSGANEPERFELRVDGWLENPAVKALGFQVLGDCVYYAFRAISITESLSIRAELRFQKKKALAEQADVEMADASRPGPSIQSLVDKSVSAALKSRDKKPSGAKGPSKAKDGRKKKAPAPPRKNGNPKDRKGGKPLPRPAPSKKGAVKARGATSGGTGRRAA
ncbi:hypothetical protein C8R45DRAFT_834429, partial [Mycena sanguinolenta]